MTDTPADRAGQSARRRARRRRQRSQSSAARTQGAGQGAQGQQGSQGRGAQGQQGAQSRAAAGARRGTSQGAGRRGQQQRQAGAAGAAARAGEAGQTRQAGQVTQAGQGTQAGSSGTLSDHYAADQRNEARARANRRRIAVLAGGSTAIPAIVLGVVLGVVVGIVAGAVVAVVVLVVGAIVLVHQAQRLALGVIGGRAASDEELPALANQVDGLSATIGVRRPRLWVVDDAVPNACALSGRRDDASVLVVTTGLLRLLGVIELEGVLAHELVHIKREDAAVSAVAVATAGLLAAVAAGDGFLHRVVGHGREYEADQAAALAVRYPPGLHDALAAFGARTWQPTGERSPFGGWRWTAARWIWIDPMVGVAGAAERSPIGELDATDVRAEALGQR